VTPRTDLQARIRSLGIWSSAPWMRRIWTADRVECRWPSCLGALPKAPIDKTRALNKSVLPLDRPSIQGISVVRPTPGQSNLGGAGAAVVCRDAPALSSQQLPTHAIIASRSSASFRPSMWSAISAQ